MSTNEFEIEYTDEEYEELLDEMIYSGDFIGFMRRKSKQIISIDFLDFLRERERNADDSDDKNVLNEIILLVNDKLKLSDGLSNSESVFDQRLDAILYTAPNKRLDYIETHKDDMTEGFVTHVRKLLNSEKDIDNKVVFASILQLISKVKGVDYIGTEVSLLSRADSSLGDEFAKDSSSALITEGDSMATSEVKNRKIDPGDRNEQILAGLLFSKNDILEDVLNNLQYLDDDFVKFLEKKTDNSQDMDERMAMSSLLQTVNYVRDKVKEAESEGVQEGLDEELTIDQVKQRLKDVQAGQSEYNSQNNQNNNNPLMNKNQKLNINDFTIKKELKDTFQSILNRFLSPKNSSMSLEDIAQENYELCDMKFIEMLKKEVDDCYAQGATFEGSQYTAIVDAINSVMVKSISSAQDKLAIILSKKSLPAMEAEIIRLCRTNEMDEAITLLIEANADQAEKAGVKQASEVLRKLLLRASMEKERKLPDEQKLLRVLLKEGRTEKRKELLYEAFKPSKSMNEDGGVVNGPPLITPPVFIQLLKTLISQYGNVEGYDIFGKTQILIDEAQIVATDLYGEGMSPRDQQKYMFEKNTVSVWDLAEYEHMALMAGDEVPWRNDAYDNKMPDEVLGERVKRIGGSQDDPIV